MGFKLTPTYDSLVEKVEKQIEHRKAEDPVRFAKAKKNLDDLKPTNPGHLQFVKAHLGQELVKTLNIAVELDIDLLEAADDFITKHQGS